MANIVVTHFSGIFREGSFQSSCFYDGLIKGFRDAGHNVLQVITSDFLVHPWNGENKPISSSFQTQVIDKIKAFKPDLIISFNNSSINGIEDAVDCPIALWDADSVRFFNNKDHIKKNIDRFFFFAFSNHGMKDYKTYFNAPENRICRVPVATEVRAATEEKIYNISFIGNPFFSSEGIVNFLKQHPHYMNKTSNDLLKDEARITSELSPYNVKFDELLHYKTGHQRFLTTSNLMDLGFNIFGPPIWLKCAGYSIDIIKSYSSDAVWTLKHNELIYNRSKVALNISHSQNVTGYPWRVPDIMASSAVLLSDPKDDLQADFGDHVNLQTYNSAYEARDITKKLLADNSLCDDLVMQQNTRIEENFRWKHRFPIISQITGVDLSTAPDVKMGTYERFVLDLQKMDLMMSKVVQQAALLKRPKKKKKKKGGISIKSIIRKLLPLWMQYWILQAYRLRIKDVKEYK